MMAAYQPQPAGMHPGMAPHGHPAMTPGQPMNPAQLQQMGHPGVSGPGQPHVTQAGTTMGMQPGMNAMVGPGGMGGQHPGALMGGMPGQMAGQNMGAVMRNEAQLNQMTPQQQVAQAQLMQQQMAGGDPAVLARQQQIMHQRMMQAQMRAAQQPQPLWAQGMSPQQMHQIQANMAQRNNPGMHPGQGQLPQLPQHLVQQQQMLMQQHHNAASQQSQAAALQQQLAIQQANSQHSNQGQQPGAPNQQPAQGQHPAQMRPQSRTANPNEQNQAQAQAQANAQQGQPGQPQGQPNQQGGQPANPQAQAQQMNPQQAQAQAMAQRQRMMQAQQQERLRQQMIQNQSQLTGQAILFFLNMCDQLCNFDASSGLEIDLWRTFVDKHFSADAELCHSFQFHDKKKSYTVLRASIARYFEKYFEAGAQSVRLHTERVNEERVPPNNRLRVTSALATIKVVYANGARLEMKGTLQADFSLSMVPESIQRLEFETSDSEEVIGRGDIERLLSNWSPMMSNKASPKMTKKNLPKAQQKMQSQMDGLTIDHFPKANKGSWGSPSAVQQFLEMGENFNVMNDLMAFAQKENLRPMAAMAALVDRYQTEGPPGSNNAEQQAQLQMQMQQAQAQAQAQGNPQLQLPPNGVPMTQRTPSMQSMQGMNMPMQAQFASPSVSHLNLPNGMGGGQVAMNGSPHITHNPALQNAGLAPNMNANMMNSHTPSPHMGNMGAPAMVPQHSQQGTNSSGPSANTSPNVNNKRRRSTVKMEGDEGGGDGAPGAQRVKPSPRMGKKGKP